MGDLHLARAQSLPMHLIMQSNVGTNGFSGVMPSNGTPAKVDFQIDSVTVSKYNR